MYKGIDRIHVQGTFTPLVHARAGRTPPTAADRRKSWLPLSRVMARTLRAVPSALRIAIHLLSRRYAPGHQADAAVSRPHERARVYVSR